MNAGIPTYGGIDGSDVGARPSRAGGPQAAVRPRLAGARTIPDDKRLLQVLTELICEQPDGWIARAAGPVGCEDANRLARIVAGYLGVTSHSRDARKRHSRCAAVPTRKLHHWLLIPLIF
jgi:hypothetical protein